MFFKILERNLNFGAPESKTYILHCRMYVFFEGQLSEEKILIQFLSKNVQNWRNTRFFGILDLQNIAKIGKNLQKLAKSYILQCKIVFFDFQGGCQKHM